MATAGHFVKYDEKACALYNLIKNALINFLFDVATDIL